MEMGYVEAQTWERMGWKLPEPPPPPPPTKLQLWLSRQRRLRPYSWKIRKACQNTIEWLDRAHHDTGYRETDP